MIEVRTASSGDLPEMRAIQDASPQAAQWDPADYLYYDVRVAVTQSRVVGFAVLRTLLPGEYEILNVAVHPEMRRQGIAKALFGELLARGKSLFFLEVRPSNDGARAFYKSLGFKEVSVRPDYYENPLEPAIVMKFHSC
jgi:ribosomal-protein-alanine acetyltransferase